MGIHCQTEGTKKKNQWRTGQQKPAVPWFAWTRQWFQWCCVSFVSFSQSSRITDNNNSNLTNRLQQPSLATLAMTDQKHPPWWPPSCLKPRGAKYVQYDSEAAALFAAAWLWCQRRRYTAEASEYIAQQYAQIGDGETTAPSIAVLDEADVGILMGIADGASMPLYGELLAGVTLPRARQDGKCYCGDSKGDLVKCSKGASCVRGGVFHATCLGVPWRGLGTPNAKWVCPFCLMTAGGVTTARRCDGLLRGPGAQEG